MSTAPILQSRWSQHAPGPMFGTAASTGSTRRRRRRSATARTRCAASASAIARPTPRRSASWQSLRDELDARRSARRDDGRPASTGTAPVDRAADGRRGRRRRRPPAGAARRRRRPRPTDLGDHQAELAKLELAERTLERRGSSSSAATPPLRRPRSAARPPRTSSRCGSSRPRRPSAPARPGDPRRPGPGAQQRDLPGRVHRARHRLRPAPRPDRAALPARAAPPRARRRPGVHQPAPAAAARRARARRRDHRHGRAHADADRASRSRRELAAPADVLSDGQRRRSPCAWRRRRCRMSASTRRATQRRRGRPGSTDDDWVARGPRRWSRVRHRSGRGPRPPQLRTPVHARARRADRRTIRRTIAAGRRDRRPPGDPDRTATGEESA